jgi:hypothetical protein
MTDRMLFENYDEVSMDRASSSSSITTTCGAATKASTAYPGQFLPGQFLLGSWSSHPDAEGKHQAKKPFDTTPVANSPRPPLQIRVKFVGFSRCRARPDMCRFGLRIFLGENRIFRHPKRRTPMAEG